MFSFQLQKNYRNPALLKVAARAPFCMNPWCEFGPSYEPGSIVGCHSNLQRHGHGGSIKAHDLVAFLCFDCHNLLDGRAKGWSPEKKELVFLESAFQSVLWMLRMGILKLASSTEILSMDLT